MKGIHLREGRYKCKRGHRFNKRTINRLPDKTRCPTCFGIAERMPKKPRYFVLIMKNVSGGIWHGFSTKRHAEAWLYSQKAIKPRARYLFKIEHGLDLLRVKLKWWEHVR